MQPLFLLAADTLLVRPVPPVRTGFEQVLFVAAGLAQILMPVVFLLLILLLFRIWKAQQNLHEQLARLTSKVDPMIASATLAAENVRVLTDVVRKDAVRAAGALAEATGRVRDSVGGIADRIDDFGDLLGRVHGKADAVADVAEAAMDTRKLGSRVLRPLHERGDDLDERAHHRDAKLADSQDDEHDDSPYAATLAEPPRPARRRRRRGRRPPA